MATKRALLIGCNYTNTPNQLQGCINDCIQWHGLLQDVYGFDEKDIVFLRDDKADVLPTKQRIITELNNLINSNSSYISIYYSGHGTSIKDTNNDENDGLDECIVPCDFKTSGIINDDDLNKIISVTKSAGIAVFDCCRSGTILDLSNEGIINTKPSNIDVNTINGLICLAGCKDDQQSAEVYNLTNMLPQGALTITLINALRRSKYYPKLSELLNTIKNNLTFGGLTQQPILTSTYPVYNDSLFPLIPTYISSLNSSTQLTSQITQLTNQNKTLLSQITQLTTQNKALSSQITQLTSQNNLLKSQVASLNSTLTTQNNNFKISFTNLNNTITNLNNQLAKYTKK